MGEVRDVVFRRMDDPILLVQIDHRRLDVGVAQHGLNGPDAQGPAAAMFSDIVLFGVILARPPQPTEERMFGQQPAKGRGGVRDRMVSSVIR